MPNTAVGADQQGRFREIISDPLNFMIRRNPRAGSLDGHHIILHNGLKVPAWGPYAYYEEFSEILIVNRGVHEPLEEFVFQETIKHLPDSPVMLELGAYWAHYSMWLKSVRNNASVHMLEPDQDNLEVGKMNFELNGFTGEFTLGFVTKDQFSVDRYLAEKEIEKLDILHCDIQGDELHMLNDCTVSLKNESIDYLFISTHSQNVHEAIIKWIEPYHYRVDVTSDFEEGTTSHDGFILLSSHSIKAVFNNFTPMGRIQIENAQPAEIIEYLSTVMQLS